MPESPRNCQKADTREIGKEVGSILSRKHFISLILFFLVQLIPLGANSIIFDHITQKDGLANNGVSGIVQDKRGYLWFGTQNGLSRYDGKVFLNYEHNPFEKNSLPHNLVQTLYLDPIDPYLWIGTYEGLSRFNLETEEFFNFSSYENKAGDVLSNEVVTSIVRDEQGVLWAGTLNGLNRIDPVSLDIRSYFHNELDEGSLLHNTIRSLYVDTRGRLWVGSYGGLDLYQPETDSFGHFRAEEGNPQSLPSPFVMSICQTDDFNLWVGTWDGGVSLLDPLSGAILEHIRFEGNTYLLSADPSGDLWIGTWGDGLYRWSASSKELIHHEVDSDDPYKLNHGIIYSFLRDRGGVYWIGTNGRGVNKLNPQKKDFRYISHTLNDPLSLPEDKIRDILIDSQGRFWIATYSEGLWRFEGDKRDWKVQHWMPDTENPWSLSHFNVATVIEDSQGRFWVGSLGGLDRYNPKTNDFDRVSLLGYGTIAGDEPIVDAITEDVDGTFWIGTNGSGIIHWSKSDGVLDVFSYSTENPRLSNNLVFSQLLDSRGTFWVGTNMGLNRYDREKGQFDFFYHNLDDMTSLSNNVITDILEDSLGRIWVGTGGGGINLLNPGTDTFSHFTRLEGLSSNHVQAMEEDGQGRIWISTISGVSVLNPTNGSILNIDESDGIIVDQMDNSSTVDQDGYIYFGSSEGVLRFDSAILYDNPHPPALWMNEVKVMGEPYPFLEALITGEPLVLNWEQSFISFEFAALDFTSPAQNQYRYKLEGLDRQWVFSGHRNFAAYQNLPPGHYVFHVQGSNNDGVWNETSLRLPLYVKAPPWKQRWFFLLYIAGAVMAVFLISNLQANVMLKRKLNSVKSSHDHLQVINTNLEKLAWIDGLTGLSNRRYFDLSMNNLWHLAIRENKIITLLMIDVDHFKAYNDFYGHQMGDEALRTTGRLIRSVMKRDTDAVCRYGGEEFTVLLFDTNIQEGEALCDSLLEKFREEKIPHEGSSVAPYLTISIGISGFTPGISHEPSQLVDESDKALYEAKNRGRNQYVVFSGRSKDSIES
ncbi:diguanylate cyclase [Oceanispirochaeta crateris]|uniref:diguanylate cyclase n=1 Tax=Oceanispirochaeta crateris TaxID=2518645 RepID=A0A5C1QNY3_9SPIO|nr:diguanylate cyclase [Oceanispirochaeta crateris]